MDLRKLKTLIDLVSESNVSELEITEAEGTVRIVKAVNNPVVMAPVAAPVAMVAALRETSVFFAALIGAWFLKEVWTRQRVVGTVAILSGVAALRLG